MREAFHGTVGATAAESTPWWAPRPTPLAEAPNVVFVVLDDTGFAHLGCYGSDIETPSIDRLGPLIVARARGSCPTERPAAAQHVCGRSSG
jgi:hypothetical protein